MEKNTNKNTNKNVVDNKVLNKVLSEVFSRIDALVTELSSDDDWRKARYELIKNGKRDEYIFYSYTDGIEQYSDIELEQYVNGFDDGIERLGYLITDIAIETRVSVDSVFSKNNIQYKKIMGEIDTIYLKLLRLLGYDEVDFSLLGHTASRGLLMIAIIEEFTPELIELSKLHLPRCIDTNFNISFGEEVVNIYVTDIAMIIDFTIKKYDWVK